MRDGVSGRVTTATRNRSGQNFTCVVRAIHPRVSHGVSKSGAPAEFLGAVVELERIIKAAHLAIKRREQWFAKNECRIQLQRALTGGDCFIIEPEIAIELAGRVVHPKRSRVD